ncbi:hypothetical protein AB6A40_005126 [Gnathostoma spinigerum]|uniref:Protein FAM76A n=1 Tax=Gnathostoma spinigerum TaxID=75299 RepID=A0ABD6EGR6_9BILA
MDNSSSVHSNAVPIRRCCYCRAELPSATSGKSVDPQCEKCKKNEMKYKKKPTTCSYCQLPAAFVADKCVWCAYFERKFGPPVACSECKLNAAFLRDPGLKDKSVLCRLCSMSRKNPSLKNRKDFSSRHKSSANVLPNSHNKRKAQASAPYDTKLSKTVSTEAASIENVQSEHILAVQRYKDDILELQKKCAEKDRSILERDKKIATLNAEMMQVERDYKDKVSQMQRTHSETTQSLRDQIRALNKQLRNLQQGRVSS